MEFRIADTFTGSLARLTADEQKAAKTTAFDLQVNPASPGLNREKLKKTQDRNFLSARVSRDIRIIVHRTASSLMLCYVGHHDDAYVWAERRKLERHPRSIAAQRKRLKLSRKDFGNLVGVSANTIYLWETGEVSPREKSRAAIIGLRRMGVREARRLLKADV